MDTKAVVWRCSVKNLFSKTSRNSQENIYHEVLFLVKLHAWHHFRCILVNFVNLSEQLVYRTLTIAGSLKFKLILQPICFKQKKRVSEYLKKQPF